MSLNIVKLNAAILKGRQERPLTEFANIRPGYASANIERMYHSGVRLTPRAWKSLMREGIIFRVLGGNLFDKYTILADLKAAIEASSTAISFDGINPPEMALLKRVDNPKGRYHHILDVESPQFTIQKGEQIPRIILPEKPENNIEIKPFSPYSLESNEAHCIIFPEIDELPPNPFAAFFNALEILNPDKRK